MLLKVILKPRKVIITLKKSGPYYEERNYQWDLKKSKIAETCEIY